MIYFKYLMYGIYMIIVRLKGIKYFFVKKFKGQEAADRYTQKTAYLWSKYTIKTIGIELDVVGLENIPNEPCVFIGNHTSILDIPIVFYTVNRMVGFIAKKEVLKVPVLGFWLRRGHCIPLDRENPREAIKVINEGVEKLKVGYSMMIFPEGTRNKEGAVGEFKKGSLKLATKAKSPIIPVSIDRAYRSFEKDRQFKPNKIKVVFGEPIRTDNISREDEKVLHEKVREVIIENLKE